MRSDPEPDIPALLESTRTIAVVGLSPKADRDSHVVARYLQAHGYRVVPINPGFEEILGERCYPDLLQVPDDVEIDIVDVFRRSEHVPAIIDAAIDRRVRAVWLQYGIHHPEAVARARAAGLQVVQDRCIKVEHAHRKLS